jgi:hypothetical protein
MKRLLFMALFLFPQLLIAQIEVTLTVKQPPEFGFSVSKQDTTIVKGGAVVLGNDLMVYGGSGVYSYRWTPTSTLSQSTIKNPKATPTDTTNYILTITDKNGCSLSLFYIVNVRNPLVKSDLTPYPQNLKAVLFPNPNNGKFKIHLTGLPSDKIEIIIFNNAGSIVKEHIIRDFQGDLVENLDVYLASGAYVMQIESKNETLNRKFVIQ